MPAASLSLADAAHELGIRPVELAQAIRERARWRRSMGAAGRSVPATAICCSGPGAPFAEVLKPS